jgi:hypothetical protein
LGGGFAHLHTFFAVVFENLSGKFKEKFRKNSGFHQGWAVITGVSLTFTYGCIAWF